MIRQNHKVGSEFTGKGNIVDCRYNIDLICEPEMGRSRVRGVYVLSIIGEDTLVPHDAGARPWPGGGTSVGKRACGRLEARQYRILCLHFVLEMR